MTEEMELICFQIITAAGTAKSAYIQSIQIAKEGRFEEAREMMKSGDDAMVVAHEPHAKLLTWEAQGRDDILCVLLLHAEDQMMSCEVFKQMAEEFIFLYENKGLA